VIEKVSLKSKIEAIKSYIIDIIEQCHWFKSYFGGWYDKKFFFDKYA
jgi:hypothetical protein